MENKTRKLLLFSFIVLIILMISSYVNATTIKETTNTQDEYDTIEEGSIIIGVTKFTPGKVITAVRAAEAGANDALIYVSENGNDDGYKYPTMYYYILGDWYTYNEEGGISVADDISSIDIYYVNNEIKEQIEVPKAKEEYTVFFIDGDTVCKTIIVKDGETISEIPELSKEHYDFIKFVDKDGNEVTETTTVTEDMAVFAQWEEHKKNTITFIVDGIVYNETTDYVGETVNVSVPTKEATENYIYEFAGWYDVDGNKYDTLEIKDTEITLYAAFNVTITKDSGTTLKEVISETSKVVTPTTITIAANTSLTEEITILENVTLVIEEDVALRLSNTGSLSINGILEKNGGIIEQEVTSVNEITNAMNSEIVDVAVLTSDITTESSISIVVDKTVVVDLNGKTLTTSSTIENNGNLTLSGNGTIISTGNHVITNKSTGTLTIENGTYDAQANKKATIQNQGGTVTINGGTFKRSNEAGTLEGNGGNSYYTVENWGSMTINDGTFENDGHYTSMLHNGYYSSATYSLGSENPTLTIKGGKYIGGINTVKNDDKGILIMDGGEFSGYTQCVLMNWHKTTINGGTYDGRGVECTIYNAGYGATSDDAGELIINGGIFYSPEDGYIISNQNGSYNDESTVTVNGGTFKTNMDKISMYHDIDYEVTSLDD